jgi:hypothetical protein
MPAIKQAAETFHFPYSHCKQKKQDIRIIAFCSETERKKAHVLLLLNSSVPSLARHPCEPNALIPRLTQNEWRSLLLPQQKSRGRCHSYYNAPSLRSKCNSPTTSTTERRTRDSCAKWHTIIIKLTRVIAININPSS